MSSLVDNSDAVSAVYDTNNGTLTLGNVVTANGTKGIVTVTLYSDQLTSLVFIPKLYLDGIEAIQYKWIGDSVLHKISQADFPNMSHHGTVTGDRQDITGEKDDYVPNTLGRYYDRADQKIKMGRQTKTGEPVVTEWIYGPVWPVYYHLNPANYNANYGTNQPQFNVLEPDVVYYNTRAASASLGVTSPEKYDYYTGDGTTAPTVFQKKDGVVTVGLQIANPDRLAPWPTDDTINPNGYPASATAPAGDAYTNANYAGFNSWYGFARYKYNAKNKDNTIALQMSNGKLPGDSVTSDYALVVPTRIQLEGLVWAKKPQYLEPDLPVNSVNASDGTRTGKYGYGPGNRNGDEEGWAVSEGVNCRTNRIHIWDTPEEALADADGAALELNCFGGGVDLTQYLGIHYLEENLMKKESAPGVYDRLVYDVKTFKYGEEKAFGLHYEFELVDYVSSSNSTRDSRYAAFSDWTSTQQVTATNGQTYEAIQGWNTVTSKTGVIVAKDVIPLANGGSVTANNQTTSSVDREPLVRILVKNKKNEVLLDGYILLHINHTPDNLIVDNYPEYTKQFDLCTCVQERTTWAEFSKYILVEKLNNMKREAFDDYYWADCMDDPTGATVRVEDEKYVTPGAYVAIDAAAADSHERGYQLKLWNFGTDVYGNGGVPPTKGDAAFETANVFEKKALGDAIYYPNGEGVTNHNFKWVLSEEELEFLTHDKGNNEAVKVTRWIRFVAKDLWRNRNVNNYSAPYPYVWVKITFNITRKNEIAVYKEKIDNYWFHYNTGAIDGWSAAVLDIQAPRDGQTIQRPQDTWNSPISNTLVTNQINVNGNAREYKYYFAPKAIAPIEVKDPLTGQVLRKYNLTPRNAGYFEPFNYSAADGYIDNNAIRGSINQATTPTKEFRNEFNIGGTVYKLWDQIFCRYDWQHRYWNLNEPNATSAAHNYLVQNGVNDFWAQIVHAGNATRAFDYDGNGVKTYSIHTDKHTWNEANLENTLRWCTAIYDNEQFQDNSGAAIWRNAGVFNDSILYAERNGVYTPIALITQQKQINTPAAMLNATKQGAGNIQLIHWLPVGSTYADFLAGNAVENKVAEDVLNALGYPTKADGSCDFENAQAYINKQLRAWVGVVAVNDCNVAKFVKQDKYDDTNVATFLASWQRPINLDLKPIEVRLDANTNENWIYLVDYLKLYDWRGDKNRQGYMYDDHQWFWAYYNIYEIDVDMTPSRVYTNMHQANTSTFVPLNTITTQAILVNLTRSNGAGTATLGRYGFNLINNTALNGLPYVAHPLDGLKPFNRAAKNADLKKYMGLDPVNNNYKAYFGGIYYANNGDNVTEFDVRVPITIKYEWGEFTQYVQFHIDGTHGRAD